MSLESMEVAPEGAVRNRSGWTPEVARRLRNTLVLFGAILVISVSATVPYLLSRAGTHAARPALPADRPISAPRPVSPPLPEPDLPSKPETTPSLPAHTDRVTGTSNRMPAGAAVVETILPADWTPTRIQTPAGETSESPDGMEPTIPGPGVYVQVSATTLTLAQQLRTHIRRAGLAAFVVPGPSDRIVRVIIGPLASGEEIGHVREVLSARGYESFLRRYSLPATPAPVR